MAKRLRGQYSKQTKAQSRATIRAQIKADIKSGKMKMSKNEVPFGGISKAALKYATRTGARIIADRKGAKVIAEKTARRKTPVVKNTKDDLRKDLGGSGGGNIYRAPARNNRPRLRDTDNTPRKTTIRQKVGPKTKSGKFTEPKRKRPVNTQPPASKTTTKSTKVDLPKRIPTRAEVEANRRGAMYKGKLVKLSPGQIKSMKKGKGSEDTIESRLARGEEKLDVSSRNASRPSGMSPAEWRKYAQQTRDSVAKSPNVSPAEIARGRARATMTTAERRAAVIRATQQRAVAKAKARGMSDAQIKNMIAKARAEAAAIAKKAK